MQLRDIVSLKAGHWAIGWVVCLSTLVPGTLILFLFRPVLFDQLAFGKLVLLAMSITMPVVAVNVLVALPPALIGGRPTTDPEHVVELPVLYTSACAFAALALLGSIAIAYVFAMTFRQFCVTVVAIELVLAVWEWVNFLRNVRK